MPIGIDIDKAPTPLIYQMRHFSLVIYLSWIIIYTQITLESSLLRAGPPHWHYARPAPYFRPAAFESDDTLTVPRRYIRYTHRRRVTGDDTSEYFDEGIQLHSRYRHGFSESKELFAALLPHGPSSGALPDACYSLHFCDTC